jgi:hypothetical protein
MTLRFDVTPHRPAAAGVTGWHCRHTDTQMDRDDDHCQANSFGTRRAASNFLHLAAIFKRETLAVWLATPRLLFFRGPIPISCPVVVGRKKGEGGHAYQMYKNVFSK